MKRTLFILILSLIIISIVPVAAKTYEFNFGDQSIWEPVEESYNEGQIEREKGPMKVARELGVGWFKPGNAVKVLGEVDFENALVGITAKVASNFAEGFFAEEMPDAVFELRIDSYKGTVIAIIKPEGSGAWDAEVETECIITDAGREVKGKHTIYIVNQIGTPEEYLDETVKETCNFTKLTLETSTVEPTASPTPEPTVEPTAEPTTEPTVEPTANPTVAPTATPKAKDDGSNAGLYIGIISAVLIVVIVIVIILLIKKKKKQ